MPPHPMRAFPRLAPVLAVLLSAAAAAPHAAWAQQPAADKPADKRAVTPPVLQKFVDAPYPLEAEKAALEGNVVLQLDIDASGAVTNVTVLNPVGHGFDEAAVAAAKQFVFQPALRDGKPVASRIAYRYAFHLKVQAPPAEPGAPPPPPVPKTVLRGVVHIGSSTVPLSSARVKIRGPAGFSTELTTGEDGAWVINDLAPGKYAVSVESPGYEGLAVEEEVSLGQATEVVYRMRAAGDATEIIVRGEKPPREVTKRTLQQRELTRIPGTGGDALRAIQNLPGVARPPGLAGFLIVRGSAPQDTQVFVDGTFVPLVYHFGGLSSVIPTEMIERLDFYPGNFSAQYGRVQGGIVDVGVRGSKKDGKYHGLVQADFIDTRVMAEGPVPYLKNVTFIVGGRRSWVDVWLKPALEEAGAGVTSAPVYYDYQSFLEMRPTAKSLLRVGFFGSDDRLEILIKNPLAQDPILGGNIGLHTGFWRLQALYRHDLTDDLRVQSVLAYGSDQAAFNLGSLYFKLDSHPISNRLELSYRMSKGATLHIGQDLLYQTYDIDLRFPPPPRPGEPDPGPFATRPARRFSEKSSFYLPAAFAELELVPHERLRLVPGFRADYTKSTGKWDASPRVNGRYVVKDGFPKTTLKGGIGTFHQPPQPQETARVFGSPNLSSNRATHYSLGVEQDLTKQINVSVEGFYKQLDSLVGRQPTPDGGYQYHNRGSGYVIGSEVLLRYKPDARFFGWIAYTLSRSARRNGPGEPLQLVQFDQTHILTSLGSYRLGRGWEFGARFRLISGSLDTPCFGGIYNSAAGAYACVSGAPNGTRLPMFHQLDLRVDKRWDFEDWRLSAYLDLLNVYNRGNPEALTYNYNFTQATYQTGLPIIPSIGVRGEF
jgi:TonB family protein